MRPELWGDVCLMCGCKLTKYNRVQRDGRPLMTACCVECAEFYARAVRVAKREWYGGRA